MQVRNILRTNTMLANHIYVFLASFVLTPKATSPHVRESYFNYVSACGGNYGTALEEHGNVPTFIVCATVCFDSPYCASSLYNIGTKSCKLNMETWLNYTTTGCSSDVLYFERLPSCVPQFSCTTPYKGMRLCEGGGPGVCDTSQGRIEILHQGTWHRVCDDRWEDDRPTSEYFGDTNSNVMCRMLGYTNGTAKVSSYFGHGNGFILLDNVSCQGNESSLKECPANAWGDHNCGFDEDAGVSCS